MPIFPVKLRPGIAANVTPTFNEGGWQCSNLIRWRDGLPQKMGGWSRFYNGTLSGIVRALHGWQDLSGISRLAAGSTAQLASIGSGILTDITPQSLTNSFAPDFSTTAGSATVQIVDGSLTGVSAYDAVFFSTPVAVGGLVLKGLYQISAAVSATTYQITANALATSTVANGGVVPSLTTTNGSPIVTVTLTAHGLATGAVFTFPIATSVGGLSISGSYAVTATGANTFTISAPTTATSGATVSMNSGNAKIVYWITIGPQQIGSGYGLGGYGDGGYGVGVTVNQQTGTPISASDWSLANWGQILVGCPKGGGIFVWDPSSGYLNAQIVSTAPPYNNGVFVAMPAQILVAWGSVSNFSSNGQQQDPLLVRWSDSLDYTNWIVSSATQAGSFRLPTGSRIVAGMQAPTQSLLWTDIELWAMQYLGPPLVYGFNKLGSGCGLIGQHAMTQIGGAVYWMSSSNFFVLSASGPQPIPCSVWDVVFQDLDTANASKCVAAPNSDFSEIEFHYPSLSGGTGEPDKYVKVNVRTGEWDHGTGRARTAAIDRSALGTPIGVSPQGLIYSHETTKDADGQAISWFIESGYFMIAQGDMATFVDQVRPDFRFGDFNGAQSAQVQVTLTAVNDFSGQATVKGPYTVSSPGANISTRLRGHRMKIRLSGSDVGSFAKLGDIRYRGQPDGRR